MEIRFVCTRIVIEQDQAEREEAESILDLYKAALGMA